MKKKVNKRKKVVEIKSEFGKGLAYCIGLFLCHSDRKCYTTSSAIEKKKIPIDFMVEMRFNGASGHLYELDTSTVKNKKLKKEIEEWRAKVLHWGHGFKRPYATEVDKLWSIDKAKEFLRRLDETNGVKTIQGSWE